MRSMLVRGSAVAVLAGLTVAVFVSAAPAGPGKEAPAIKVKGTQSIVDEKKGMFAVQGSLLGTWNVTAFTEHYVSATEYSGTGRERFQGCHDANRNGACETGEAAGSLRFVFTYWATFDAKGQLVKGQCVHPVVGGTGAFAKAKGLIVMKDVPTANGIRTTYAGTLAYPGSATASSAQSAPARSLASAATRGGCGGA